MDRQLTFQGEASHILINPQKDSGSSESSARLFSELDQSYWNFRCSSSIKT
jgi:hypothetical protein